MAVTLGVMLEESRSLCKADTLELFHGLRKQLVTTCASDLRFSKFIRFLLDDLTEALVIKAIWQWAKAQEAVGELSSFNAAHLRTITLRFLGRVLSRRGFKKELGLLRELFNSRAG